MPEATAVTRLRPELPPLPASMAHLPVHRGYPVPWFVAWLDSEGRECLRGQGEPDFRVTAAGAVPRAVTHSLCWVCGRPMTDYPVAFVVGPMCAINHVSSEPPSHPVCAGWSARACPFLTRPHARRREAGLPEAAAPAPGTSILRNPGVALVWLTHEPSYFSVPPGLGREGLLFDIGPPAAARWWAEGRRATRAEVLASIESGLPLLRAAAEHDGPEAIEELERKTAEALALVPREEPARA